MAIVKPFRALRPSKESAGLIASVPYDVVDREEAAELAKNNPLSFLRISRSEIDLPPNIDPYSSEVYQKAKENLEKLIETAPLTIDQKEHFYIYKIEMNGHSQAGIAGVFSIDDYENNVILKHEKTRKVKEDDRTNHIITTNAQTGMVFLTYRSVPSISNIVNRTILESEPLYDFTAYDGIKHTVWLLSADYNSLLQEEFSKIKNLYIADGHHRAASAARVRKIKQEENPTHRGDKAYNYFLAVLFPDDQVKILPYNRIVYNLNGLNKKEFLNKIKENFSVERNNKKAPDSPRNFGMYLDGDWYQLKLKDNIKSDVSSSATVSGTLDVSILHDFLMNPILGIADQRTNKNIDFVGGIRGTRELKNLVDSKKAAAAFSLYPVRVEDLIRIADAGEIMPPKSTWFEPKLRDGLLIYLIK